MFSLLIETGGDMQMKFRYLGALLIVCSVILLGACGEKSQSDVEEKLTDVLSDMNGYKAEAEMAMKTGEEEQRFSIDIWHQKEDYYRVKLGHTEDERGSQIILKNEDGVFVLTPALERSFRFQSEWPENSSQPYLFQSLVKDILEDEEAAFEATDTHYVFKTKTNYQSNSNFPSQQIHIDKKTYYPSMVQVLNQEDQALVEVQFSSFDTEVSFESDDFAMEKNMETTEGEPALASAEEDEDAFTVFHPLYTAGAEPASRKEIDLDNGKRVILTYEGEKNFTLIQEKLFDAPAMEMPETVEGEIINLGYTVGALSDQTLEWSHEGIEYTLASDTLSNEELIEVAQSIQGQEIK
jgi:outer membrane lipoprotein-sorting protein